jgi:hypothetical protein
MTQAQLLAWADSEEIEGWRLLFEIHAQQAAVADGQEAAAARNRIR